MFAVEPARAGQRRAGLCASRRAPLPLRSLRSYHDAHIAQQPQPSTATAPTSQPQPSTTDMSAATDVLQATFGGLQALFAMLTFFATLLIGWVGILISRNQLRPFLCVDAEYSAKRVRIAIQNQGMGPAQLTRVRYKLNGETNWREDTVDGRKRGNMVYLVDLDTVLSPVPFLNALSQDINTPMWYECEVAGRAIGAGNDLLILELPFDPDTCKLCSGTIDNTALARQWRWALYHKLRGGECEIEYEDANGWFKYTFKYSFAPPQ